MLKFFKPKTPTLKSQTQTPNPQYLKFAIFTYFSISVILPVQILPATNTEHDSSGFIVCTTDGIACTTDEIVRFTCRRISMLYSGHFLMGIN